MENNFKTEEELKRWANTTLLRRLDGGTVQVKYWKDDLYYLFLKKVAGYTLCMTSIHPQEEKTD